MPNWTDDEGRNHFGKLDCKRCLQTFDANEVGEIPIHKCHGGYYKSGWDGLCHHAPIKVSNKDTKAKMISSDKLCQSCNGDCCVNKRGTIVEHGSALALHSCPACNDGTEKKGDFISKTLATICANKAVTLTRKELNLFAKETGMVHLAAWGGWKISYQKIAPDVYSVRLGERFQNKE